MARELLILRHGKAAIAVDTDDIRRPLKDGGKRNAQRMGVWLQQHDLIPDHIVASTAERAATTAQKCCKTFGVGTEAIEFSRALYLASQDTLLDRLARLPDAASRVMLVGHNPGLEQLLAHLVGIGGARGPSNLRLDTGSLAHIELTDHWDRLDAGAGRLISLVHAADLPTKFPYPGPHSTELRDRPAYYYTQSAVIPYRLRAGHLEILIIRSSKGKHWVVPKGIADPGMTLQASAAKEAWEEAGIEGRIAERPIGRYQVAKWGATCDVTVYAMLVEREIDEVDWEERHRGRSWVSPDQAALFLHQPDLRNLILALKRRLVRPT